MDNAPNYVFTDCPSSSTGKYHHKDEFDGDGTIIHTKRVFITAICLAKAFGISTEEDMDILKGAAILHDIRKQGIEKSGYTVKDHPELAVALVEGVYGRNKSLINDDILRKLTDCIKFHMGIWGNTPKSMKETTPLEWCIHIADFVASKPATQFEINS